MRGDSQANDVRALLDASPTGRNLLQAVLVLPRLDEDPSTSVGTWPDGAIAYWNDSGTLRVVLYDRATGWQQV